MGEEQAPSHPPLDCFDFDGPCCGSCDEDTAVLKDVEGAEKEIFAVVCCQHIAQAELRRDGITMARDI